MTTLSLRARRLQEARNKLSHVEAQREETIGRLIKLEGKRQTLSKQVARYAKPAPAKPARPEPRPEPASDIPVSEFLGHGDALADLGVPDFLKRQSGDERDRVAREAILAQQAERKRNKAHIRIEEMKAKKAGLTRRMPLEGKAALAAIREAQRKQA